MSLPSALADGSIRIKYYGFSQKRNSAKACPVAILFRWLKPTAMNYKLEAEVLKVHYATLVYFLQLLI